MMITLQRPSAVSWYTHKANHNRCDKDCDPEFN